MAVGPAASVCSKRCRTTNGWYRPLPREDSDRYADLVPGAGLRRIRPAHKRIPSSATPPVHKQGPGPQPAEVRTTVSFSYRTRTVHQSQSVSYRCVNQAITRPTPPVILLRGNNQERRGFLDEK